jgi:pyrimidine-specific ribonucleoside hydrolase
MIAVLGGISDSSAPQASHLGVIAMAVTLAGMSVDAQPMPLVIDTDPGIDDAAALLLALTAPEVRVLAVTTVFGNADLATTTRNARRLVAMAGRTDVPVAAGAARPLVFAAPARPADKHGADGLGGRAATLPEPGPLVPRGAVPLLADVLAAAESPVTVLCLGPLTNLAVLLASHPWTAERIARVVVMGGRLDVADEPDSRGGADPNLRADPEAAHRVLAEEAVPVVLVPLDLTLRCTLPGTCLDRLATAGPRAALLASVIQFYRDRYRAQTGRDEVPLHDAVALLEAARPGTLRVEPMRLAVACAPVERRGVLRTEHTGPRPVDVALDVAVDVGKDIAVDVGIDVPVDPSARDRLAAPPAEILRRLHALDARPPTR